MDESEVPERNIDIRQENWQSLSDEIAGEITYHVQGSNSHPQC